MWSPRRRHTDERACLAPPPSLRWRGRPFLPPAPRSSQQPVFFSNSMPAKVWRSGALQIVQNIKVLPPSLHPRSQLTGEWPWERPGC